MQNTPQHFSYDKFVILVRLLALIPIVLSMYVQALLPAILQLLTATRNASLW